MWGSSTTSRGCIKGVDVKSSEKGWNESQGWKKREKHDANSLPEVSGGVSNAKREVCLMVRTVEREMRGERVSKGWWEVITDE